MTSLSALGVILYPSIETIEIAGSVLGWALFGILVCVAGLKLIDWLTPGKLEEQVFGEKNVAAALVYGAAFIAIAIIIHGAMH